MLLVGQVLINNGDLLLSKAFFDPETAGVYASAALIGRAVFFLSWSIVHAVFPVAARTEVTFTERRRAIRSALVLVSVMGATGLATVLVAGDLVASLMFGDRYAAASGILAPYVAATSLFAIANLLASVEVAGGRLGAPIVLVGGAVLQTALLSVAGHTPQSMVWLQVVAMALTVAAVVAARWAGDRNPVDINL